MKIGLAAVDMKIVAKESRRHDIAAFIDQAADAGCQMVFFPEYVNCQRTKEAVADWDAGDPNTVFARHAEAVPGGPACKVILGKCRERAIWCGFGLNERTDNGCVINSFLLVDSQGRIAGRHVKTHLPECEEGITPADELETIDSPLGKLGVLTCWEAQYPELVRMYQILGADLLVFPTAQHEPFALTIARVRAYDANRPLLALSYVWAEKPDSDRPCGAAYIDEKGEVLARSENHRHLLVVDVPVKKGANDVRFERRRPHVYRRIVET
jgi:predicted amidohydrolase